MPADTHHRGWQPDPEVIVELPRILLSDHEDLGDEATLVELGVDAEGLADLWDAVHEEFAERGVGAEIDRGDLDSSMTLADVAKATASLLHDGADERRGSMTTGTERPSACGSTWIWARGASAVDPSADPVVAAVLRRHAGPVHQGRCHRHALRRSPSGP